jgi:hypothetical protein
MLHLTGSWDIVPCSHRTRVASPDLGKDPVAKMLAHGALLVGRYSCPLVFTEDCFARLPEDSQIGGCSKPLYKWCGI